MDRHIVHLSDGGGGSIEFLEYGGMYYPAVFELEILDNLQNLAIRPDDVVLSCYPKSGTHWFWENLSLTIARNAENMRETWNGDFMLEYVPQSSLDAAPSPRVFTTHLLFEQLPRGIVEKGCKIVYLMRNPKDVAVSMHNHHKSLKYMYKYDGEWKHYLNLFLKGNVDWGSWFDHTINYHRAMKAHPHLPILPMYYEDMKQDPVARINELGKFLGVDIDDQLSRDIAEKCGFNNMKSVVMETGKGLIQDGVPTSFRKGCVSDWKNWFTVAQNEEFDRVYREKMVGYDIPFKYSLD